MSQLINFLDFVNEQFAPEQVSLHDELSDLTWFGHFTLLLEALGSSVQWSTGAKAYANGTRVLTVTDQQRAHKEHYRFYPLKRNINLRSLIDWNRAFETLWIQKVSQLLGISRHRVVRTAVENRDIDQFEKWIEAANSKYGASGYKFPDLLLLAIEEVILSPEEAEAIQYMRSVGLIK